MENKKLSLFLALPLLLAFPVYSQNIDSIQTNEQALAFVRKLDSGNRSFCLRPQKIVFDAELDSAMTREYDIRAFEKADIDNNGLTDLLFNGYDCYELNSYCNRVSLVILSFEKDSFKVENLCRNTLSRYLAAQFVSVNRQALVRIIWMERSVKPEGALNRSEDTLVYAWHNFIEKEEPSHHRISKVNYYLSSGMGAIQDFEITVTPDSSWMGLLYAEENFCRRQHRSATDRKIWEQLTGMLNQLDFNSLKDSYELNATCCPTGYLTIEMENGKTKKIDDYCLEGTYGLEAIHHIFLAIRDLPSWIFFDEVEAW